MKYFVYCTHHNL